MCVSAESDVNGNQVRHHGAAEQKSVTVIALCVRSCVHGACTIVLGLGCCCGPVVALNNHSAGVLLLLLLFLLSFVPSLSLPLFYHSLVTLMCKASSTLPPFSRTLLAPCNFFLLWLQQTGIKDLRDVTCAKAYQRLSLCFFPLGAQCVLVKTRPAFTQVLHQEDAN